MIFNISKISAALLLCMVAFSPVGDEACAQDMGWLRPGVRAWYHGGTGTGADATNAEEANLIESCGGFQCVVAQHQAVQMWTSPLPSSRIQVPDAASEGEFWINPARLSALVPVSGTIVWKDSLRLVADRRNYTISSVPFMLTWQSMVLEQLFAVKSPREIVYIKNQQDGQSVGHYYFDVETGLLLHKSEQLGGYSTHLTLAEINYDFEAGTAFAEDYGPHAGFSWWYYAGRADVYQYFIFNPVILSRHKDRMTMTLFSNLSNVAGGQQLTSTTYVRYDASGTGSVAEKDYADSSDPWRDTGDHLFWWVPKASLSKTSINVYGLDLSKQSTAGDYTAFAASEWPSGAGFMLLIFDKSGYAAAMAVAAPSINFLVDSRSAAQKTFEAESLDYFMNNMQPGAPATTAATAITKLRPKYSVKGKPLQIPFKIEGLTGQKRRRQAAEYTVRAVSGDIAKLPAKNLRIKVKKKKCILTVKPPRKSKGTVPVAIVAASSNGGVSVKTTEIRLR